MGSLQLDHYGPDGRHVIDLPYAHSAVIRPDSAASVRLRLF